MSHKQSVTRLLREYEKLQRSTNNQFVCEPNPSNLFEWHFIVYNLSDYYQGGQYHGVLIMPSEYPLKPPTLKFITPSGRFETGKPICLSFTAFHPESWSSAQTIESMMISLISFMFTNENTTGGMITNNEKKREFAAKSISFNLQDQQFNKLFKKHFVRLGIKENQIDNPKSNVIVEEEQSITLSQFLIGGTAILLLIYFILYSLAE